DYDYLPGDVVFFDYVIHFAREKKRVGGWSLLEPPAARPTDEPYGDILWLGCGNLFAKGRYAPADMMLPFYGPVLRPYPAPRSAVSGTDQAEIDRAAVDVGAVAIDPGCQSLRPMALLGFVHATDRGKLEVWIRKRAPQAN
ncbi:MAG TPA: hypothetical protein VIF15_07605, partial [Polyangiaceae bacterium]